MSELLERDGELSAIGTALDAAGAGTGGTLIVEGAAGIGKTRLLAAAAERARAAGFRVLGARGGEFESAFPFGVVRQLFEAPLVALETAERERVLAGAAGRAGALLFQDDGAARSDGDEAFAVVHGLYWLAANLTADRPLVLIVDDAHWADAPSLRWLAYLARRVDELPVLVLLAQRPAEPGAQMALLGALAAEPHSATIRPALLGEAATGELLEGVLGSAPDAGFRAACHEATGGNPFLLGELAMELAADGIDPTADAARRVADLRPEAVSRAVLLRVGRLPSNAFAVARAVAVLGERTELRRVAALEELEEDAASVAADALAAASILAPGRPLSFAHPIIRTAIYAELQPSARAHAHARAARVLHAEGARVDEVASHLLATEPDGDPWVLEQLLTAARRALAEGANEGAIPYLRRALGQELERGGRARLLLELGTVEARLSSPSVVTVLEEAVELADDPQTRGVAAFELGRALVMSLRFKDGMAVFEQGIEATREADPDLARRLRAELIGVSRLDDSLRDHVRRHLPVLRAQLDEAGDARGLVLANLAWEGTILNEPADDMAALAAEALDGGGLLASEGSDSPMFMLAMGVLLYANRYDYYDRKVEDAIESARRRGSTLGFAYANCLRAYWCMRTGALEEAKESSTAALDAMTDVGWQVVLLIASFYLADALYQSGDLDGAEAVLRERGFQDGIPAFTPFNVFWNVRGKVRIERGDVRGGLSDLLECGRRQDTATVITPAIIPWRSDAALAHAKLGERAEAIRLADEEVALARDFGAASSLGIALRAAGTVRSGREGLPFLEEAVAVLDGSGARLELARAQAELGAAHRRRGRRSEAIELLRTALDGASRCGARPLEETVRDELRAAGVRPRRTALSGIESLTPSERRVAELVAQGLGNAEIAQALFVTRRTVEYHLTNAFRKLGVASREELAGQVRGVVVA